MRSVVLSSHLISTVMSYVSVLNYDSTASANGFYYYLHTCCSRGIVLNKNSNLHTCVFHVPLLPLSLSCILVLVLVVVLRPRLWHRLPDKLTKRQNRCRHFRMLAPLLAKHNNNTHTISHLLLASFCSRTLSGLPLFLSLFLTALCAAYPLLRQEKKVRADDAAAQKCWLTGLRQTCLLAKMVCFAIQVVVVVAAVVVVAVVGNQNLATLGT